MKTHFTVEQQQIIATFDKNIKQCIDKTYSEHVGIRRDLILLPRLKVLWAQRRYLQNAFMQLNNTNHKPNRK